MPIANESSRVVLVLPVASAENSGKNLPLWIERGYRLLLIQDRYRYPVDGAEILSPFGTTYTGWPRSVNWLCKHALPTQADLVVIAGDDMRPDPKLTAEQIRERYYQHFPDGLGVMQPVGDTMDGTLRICGSPIVGRGWATRGYMGRGPLCPDYFQFYADEELFEISRDAGRLWQDPETCHYHDHWTRRGVPAPPHHQLSQDHWDRDKVVFFDRKPAKFPGSAPAEA